MKKKYGYLFIITLFFACVSKEPKDYYQKLNEYEQFQSLQSSPPKSNFGEVESIKVIYDFIRDEIYYIDSKKYPSHYDFARKKMSFTKEANYFFYDQFGSNTIRSLHLITINYHKNIDKYVFEFSAYDLVDCKGIYSTYKKLIETTYFKDKLYFHANNLNWKNCENIPVIKSDELFSGQNYQALNLEEAYGYLRKFDVKDVKSKNIGKHDIILLNGIPNDLPVVSGIICTEFQSVLSHINILSHNRNTPNMSLKDAWTNPKLDSLYNKFVYLKVENNAYVIHKASAEEASDFWNKREPQKPITLEKDTKQKELIDLNNAHNADIKTIGGKAANFFELVNLKTIPLPENPFAIPFYFYEQHLKINDIDTFIDSVLSDPQFKTDIAYRKEKLKQIRALIVNAPLNSELRSVVLNEINNFKQFDSYRFRSSTNAEDVDFFNGAGLYDSYSAKKNDTKKTIDNAIKKVWASLWNFRAFEEREYYKINQHSVSMGVLVHRSFPDEDANGVVITKNLFNINHGYTINAQYKDISTVSPKAGAMCDQIIAYTINLIDNKYTFEYLNYSNIPDLKAQPVLTIKELTELSDYCTKIKEYYFNKAKKSDPKCSYNDFAVDIEFKLDSKISKRKIYIKQVRIYRSRI